MAVFVTLCLLAFGALVLIDPNKFIPESAYDDWQKAAIGWMAFILGYWLK